ncbi:hypothetical protein Tco_0630651 [Tanacetum coccineum]
MSMDGNNNGMKTRVIKKSHHVRDRGGMNRQEACVRDSHKEGSWFQTHETDQSGDVAQGCRWSTGAKTDGRCDHTSNGLFGLVAPSKCRAFPIGPLVDPSIALDGLAIHTRSCSGQVMSTSLRKMPLEVYLVWDPTAPSPVANERPFQNSIILMHARWMEYLQQFTFGIKHKAGTQNNVADALNRRATILTTMGTEVIGFDFLKDLYVSDDGFAEVWKQNETCILVIARNNRIFVLALAEFAYNNMVNCSTGKTTFSVVYHQPPNHTLNLVPLLKLPASNAKYKEDRDKHWRTKIFSEGDIVMVDLRKERFLVGTYNKLKKKKIDPCRILKKINDNAYVVDLPKDMAISNTFNVSYLVDHYSPRKLLYPNENSRSSPFQVGKNDEGDNLETN